MANRENTAGIEREVPDIIDDPESPGPLMMTKVDPAAELAKFEAAAQLLAKLVPASIRATKPQDWVKMGEKVYLQATGIERLAPLWGLAFSEPKIVREDYPGGGFGYVVSGWIRSRFGLMHVVGGRSSLDPFFDSFDEEKPSGWREMKPGDKAEWKAAHRLPPDPMDVHKSAVTNWMTRGGSMACGLRGLTPADLEANGVRGVAEVVYGKGQQGGTTAPAELKAEVTKLSNDVLSAAGGDKEAARKLFKEITAGKNFAGMDSPSGIKHQWQIDNARKALEAHPVFGKKAQREPGDEKEGA